MNRWQTVVFRIIVSLAVLGTLYASVGIAANSRRPIEDGVLAFIVLSSICALLAALVRWILLGFTESKAPQEKDSDDTR